jgi:hypothetical protein
MKTDLLFGRLILVYQMPKTGSQTVEATLQRHVKDRRVVRLHYLRSSMRSRVQELLASDKTAPSWKAAAAAQLELADSLRRAIRWRRLLSCCGFRIPKLEVIAGVRELIGLALSSIFENYAYFVADWKDLNTESCCEALLRPRMFVDLDHWFEGELKRTLGIDVYQKDFPRQKGYTILENRWVRLLVYRIEALAKLPEMLRDFLGCEVGELTSCNEAKTKPYADHYAWIRQNLSLPATFVAARYRTRIMRHFYSYKERKAFEFYWSEEGWKRLSRAQAATAAGKSYTPRPTQERIGRPGQPLCPATDTC